MMSGTEEETASQQPRPRPVPSIPLVAGATLLTSSLSLTDNTHSQTNNSNGLSCRIPEIQQPPPFISSCLLPLQSVLAAFLPI